MTPLLVDKDTTTPTVLGGGQATYTIALRNTDSSNDLTAVHLTDTLPTGFTYVAGSATYTVTDNFTLNDTLPGSGSAPTTIPAGGATSLAWGNWTLGNGDTLTITFNVNVGAAAGTYDNSTTAFATLGGTSFTVTDNGPTGDDLGTPLDQDPETDEDVTVGLSLSGKAWLDDGTGGGVANDGLRSGGEPGQAGLVVYLLDSTGVNVLQTVSTDASGNYVFGGLASSTTYIVEFGTPPVGYNFTLQNQGANDTIDSDANPATRRVSVSLVASAVGSVDAGFAPHASIGDRIWLDTDGDGIQDASESGLSGVDVFIDINTNGSYDAGTDLLQTTDASGQYLFEGLATGSYRVMVATADLPGGVTQTSDPDATRDSQHTLSVTAPGLYLDVDFGYQGTGSISGTVWNDIDGSGTQDAGEGGISGVTLWLDLNNDSVQDASEPSAATDANGLYSIGSLYAATYTVRAAGAPLSGATRTYDLNGTGTPDVTSAILTAGQNRSDVDWGYQFPALSISKTSDGAGLVSPGDTILYTITVRNNTASTHSGILINDPLPAGTAYVAQSTSASGFNISSTTYLDQFGTASYSSSNGTATWSTTWTEAGADAAGAANAGTTLITGGRLRFDGSATLSTLTRSVNLSGASASVLTFDFYRNGTIEAGDLFTVEVYNGTSWTVLDSYNGTIAATGTYTKDLSSYANANTQIRFGVTGFTDGTTTPERLELDNVQITYDTVTPITLDNDPGSASAALANGVPGSLVLAADNFALNPGQEMQVTFRVTVNDPVTGGLTSIENTAAVTSTQQTAAQSASTQDALPASLGSLAWLDLDGDGIQDGAEPGLPGVTVQLFTGAGAAVSTDITDASGGYAFSNLTPGSYYLIFSAPTGSRFTLADQGGSDASDSDTNPASGQTAAFTLGSGEANTALDAGLLPPPGAVGDALWIDEDGDGARDAGEMGIPNVGVILSGSDIFGSAVNLSTTTDADGQYLFPRVQPGSYTLSVNTTALADGLEANPTYDYDGTGSAHTAAITLQPGQALLAADFGYNWAPTSDVTGGSNTGAIGDRLWIDANGSGSQDPGEAGLYGISVQLLTAGPDQILGTGDDVIASTTTTDRSGGFIFDGLTAGAYAVRVNGGSPIAGYAQKGDPDQPGTACTSCDQRTTAPILLAPGDVYLNADFGYQSTGTPNLLGGQIFLDRNGDGNWDSGEPGISGTSVTLLDSAGNVMAVTLTDSDGQYSFAGLPDGTYTVWVNDTTYLLGDLVQSSTPDNATDGGQPCGTCNGRNTVTVSGGAGSTYQDFGYAPANHGSGDGLIGDTLYLDRDSGSDYDAGEGLAGIRVWLFHDANANGSYDAGDALIALTRTDNNGSYRFGNLPADDYVVQVDAASLPAGVTNTLDPDTSSSPANEAGLTLTAGQSNLDQDFGYAQATTPNTIGGTLWRDSDADGTLEGGETGRFAGVWVSLYDSQGDLTGAALTGDDGSFSFGSLPDGSYTLAVSDTQKILSGYWKSNGPSAGSNNNSQALPYPVTVSGGQTNTSADFGYYRDPAALGNFVWHDANGDGIQDIGETGMAGIPVVLKITWPNTAVTQLTTTTDAAGLYSFSNLLLDENFDGSGAGEPAFEIRLGTVDYPSSPQNAAAENLDSDNLAGESASAAQGSLNSSYDFGLLGLDFGDLPDTYLTALGSNGPRHSVSGLYLGSGVGGEVDATPAAAANTDTQEDGLVRVMTTAWTGGAAVQITATVKEPLASNGYLVGWFDWNNDGDFADAAEAVLFGAVVDGTNTLSLTLPVGYAAGTPLSARFRLFEGNPGAPAYTGLAAGGEVEDYRWNFSPTALTLTRFGARSLAAPTLLLLVTALARLLGWLWLSHK